MIKAFVTYKKYAFFVLIAILVFILLAITLFIKSKTILSLIDRLTDKAANLVDVSEYVDDSYLDSESEQDEIRKEYELKIGTINLDLIDEVAKMEKEQDVKIQETITKSSENPEEVKKMIKSKFGFDYVD